MAINVSPELNQDLQKLAEAEQVSVDELAEAVLADFVNKRVLLFNEEPNDEEIAAVTASIKEAEQPGAKWYEDEEFDQTLDQELARRKAARLAKQQSGAV